MKKIETTESAPVSKEKVDMAIKTLESEGLTCVVYHDENKKLPYNIHGLYISSFEYIVVLLKYRRKIKKHIHKNEDAELKNIDKELKKVLRNINISLLSNEVQSEIGHILTKKHVKKATKKEKKKKSKT